MRSAHTRGLRLLGAIGLVAVVLAVTAASCDPRPPDGTAVLYRVNAGGPALAGGWEEDSATTPSPYASFGADAHTSSSTTTVDLTHGSMPADVPEELFDTQRWDSPTSPDLSYSFPVPAGTTVQARVYLAETSFTSVGQRLFDIYVDGTLAFDEVDVVDRAGGANRALTLWREVVSDGTVTVGFAHGGASDPIVSGIEIVQVSGSTSTTSSTTAPEGAHRAVVDITPGGTINASTYNSGSIHVVNDPASTAEVASVQLDLRGAVLPDVVFDPNGTAGDTVAKPFTLDQGAGLGTVSHQLSSPHDLGYDVLQVNLTDFDPGEALGFSIDIDPTSIRGASAPGPGETGSVSGTELAGALVTVVWEDGTTRPGDVFAVSTSAGSGRAVVTDDPAAGPGLELLGLTTPTTVSAAGQQLRVTGVPGSQVQLVLLEGALFTSGLPGGGWDIDPYEANSVVAITRTTLGIDGDGTVDVPVTLTATGSTGGYCRFVAATVSGSDIGRVAATGVVRYSP